MIQKTVLLVEDNDDNRTVFATILRHYGYEVIEAEDGESGVELARTRQPDLVLMDISIPVLDGWEATRVLKRDTATSEIPVVAVTAHALSEDRARARAIGFDGFLAKPVQPRLVVEEVRRFIGPAAQPAA